MTFFNNLLILNLLSFFIFGMLSVFFYVYNFVIDLQTKNAILTQKVEILQLHNNQIALALDLHNNMQNYLLIGFVLVTSLLIFQIIFGNDTSHLIKQLQTVSDINGRGQEEVLKSLSETVLKSHESIISHLHPIHQILINQQLNAAATTSNSTPQLIATVSSLEDALTAALSVPM